MLHALHPRHSVPVTLLIALAWAIPASPSRGDLAGRYRAGQKRASQLGSAIRADTSKIQGFEGTIGALETRLRLIERSLAVQERMLLAVRVELSAARQRSTELQLTYTRDREALASEMVAQYESPQPTIVDVVIRSRGFDDLLSKVGSLKAIATANAQAIQRVERSREAVRAEARRLAIVEARRQRATAAVLVERDDVAQIRLSIVRRELAQAHDRAQKTRQLRSLRASLSREAAKLDRLAAAAQARSGGVGFAPAHGCVSTPSVAHGGDLGFFPASGTNYAVGNEPIIAARLDALGRALQMHLVGISGYRTPQHSVEVGGFADDPHTEGAASDTPGVEGIPESTLEQFCLTRPFPGPREADHIQLA